MAQTRTIITPVTLYGIKNCTTMKKTMAWFEAQGIPTVLHDYKKDGVPEARLARWCHAQGWQALLNTRGTTWRRLAPEQQAVTTQSQAIALMCAYPSVIRRPVIEVADEFRIGFDPSTLETWLSGVSSPLNTSELAS